MTPGVVLMTGLVSELRDLILAKTRQALGLRGRLRMRGHFGFSL